MEAYALNSAGIVSDETLLQAAGINRLREERRRRRLELSARRVVVVTSAV
jgi:phosphopantetheine adenylyltransferase